MQQCLWLDEQKSLAQESTNGTFEAVADSRHEIQTHQPQAVIDAVESALADVGGRPVQADQCGSRAPAGDNHENAQSLKAEPRRYRIWVAVLIRQRMTHADQAGLVVAARSVVAAVRARPMSG